MKIGTLAKKTGFTIASIRHYMALGLIIPSKDGGQYKFDDRDLELMLLIKRLKNWGLSLQDIHKIISIRRTSLGVEASSRQDYLEILSSHRLSLQQLIDELTEQRDAMDEEIRTIMTEVRKESGKKTGVPIIAIPLLSCPHCGNHLMLSNAAMDYRYLYSGSLSCSCGYSAEIKDGILFPSQTGNISEYDKPDKTRTLYRDSPSELECVNTNRQYSIDMR